jgi:hypothetical protein
MTPTATDFFSGRVTGDAEAEHRFFSSLKMRNGTFKTTRAARFEDVEAAFAHPIAAAAPRIRQVLDVGVSTGTTTLDLAGFLGRHGIPATVTGTDLFLDAHMVRLGPGLRVLTDADGWPLQYDLAGRAVRPWTRRLDYLTLAAPLLWTARRAVHARAQRAIRAGTSRPVRLVTPRVEGTVHFVENDVFRHTPAFAGRFDLIRVGNLLNHEYFSAPLLRRGLANLASYLSGPGALLWVARTRERGGNEASLFEWGAEGRFRGVAQVGPGSEIKPLLDGIPIEELGQRREAARHG